MAFRSELDDFARFYEAAYPGAYRTALAIVRDPALAADVTQDAFVAAYRARERFRGDVPSGAWLHRIVVNAALTGLRRRRPTVREIPVVAMASGDAVSGVDDRATILDALGVLAPRARAAIVLRYFHDLDHATIADALGTSVGNVAVILSRSLDRLRTELVAGLEVRDVG